MIKSYLACFALAMNLIPAASFAASSIPPTVDLKVGPLLENPLGYAERVPQFSWKLPAEVAASRQSAYRIYCSSDPRDPAGNPDLWDSGWVKSDQSLFVDYAGKPLESRQRVYWQVRYKDAEGRESAPGGVAWIEMSLLEPDDWEAEWIYLPEENPEETAPAPFFRKAFRLAEKEVRAARIYASAKGIFELEINGRRVGDSEFSPEYTDYTKRNLFATYDITEQLRQGENVIGAILGEMWYAGRMELRGNSNNYGDTPKLLLQLEVTYADGSRQTVSSDGTWTATTGPIVSSNIYFGETYDARLDLGGWSQPGYPAQDWHPVATEPIDRNILLRPQPNQPVRKIMELQARVLGRLEDGAWLFDLGQNMVGWARIEVPAQPGRTYRLRFAEMLKDDGTLYTENYRTAISTDYYTCKGEGTESWEPRFTFHGFRYVELSGVPEGMTPSADWVTGVVLHNDMPPTGSFLSSHPTLNRLQRNIQWGQRGNFLAIPTDCPQRDERLGWTGDAQVFCATANFNFNTLAFFVKWCADLRDSQYENGGIPYYVPQSPKSGDASSSAWGDAAVIVPWEVYQSFGYRRILEDNFAMMQGWLRYYEEHPETRDFIHSGYTYGDWLQPNNVGDHPRFGNRAGDTDTSLIGTAYFARCADLLGRAAQVLGKDREAERRQAEFEQIRQAFQKAFFDREGRLTTKHETQTGYLLALGFNLLTPEMEQQALEHLVRLITEEADGHLRTGFLGTPLICPVLTRYGRPDLAYSILFRTTYPGWFFSIEQGATTMWERWNSYSKEDGFGPVDMNSFNHYAYGAIGEWMYESIAGLQAAAPGYKVIRFHPVPGGPLESAAASLETPYGLARSEWVREPDGGMRLTLTVPPNTSGEVLLDNGRQTVPPGRHSFRLD